MNRTTNRTKLILIAGLLASQAGLLAHDNGPDNRHTGGPGDDPLSCATSGCHTSRPQGGPINPAGGTVTATFSSGSLYYPGVPVVITVTVTDPVNKSFGFQMSARLAGSDNSYAKVQAGSFTAAPLTDVIVICDNNALRRPGTTCPAAAPVEFIEHAAPAKAPWQFTWTPPSTASGPVRFYVAGNAVNANGQEDGGDHVYTASYELTPPVCTAVQPSITSVNSGTDFGGSSTFASGSWLEIKGQNLANTTRVWEGRDFLYANAPASIDGVRVTVNDKPAFVYYVSPTQINVQAPGDPVTGNAVAIGVNNCQGSSAPVSVQKTARAPGWLAPASFNVGGKQYLVAIHQDGAYVGRTGLIQGVTFRPAKPGDLITAYGIGFGDVAQPSFAPGVVVNALNVLASSFNLKFGLTDASLTYSGLAPGFIGLYQFNITVPQVASGDQQINATLQGTPLPQTVYLTIQ